VASSPRMTSPAAMERPRVAIIGAGASGLSQLHAFEVARRADQPGPEVVCFEKQATWGGLWTYTWRTGLDQFGEPVHGSMYRDLWSNGPKESFEFPDYPFDRHFGRPVPSFIPRAAIHGYLVARAQRADLARQIRFETVVTAVDAPPAGQRFRVSSRHLPDEREQTEEFDWIVVATGHYSVPNVPHFPGFDRFPGRILHSHDLRDVRELANRRVLIVGAGDSGEDIALQGYKYGARSVVISYRSMPIGHRWPASISEVPLLERLDGATAHFVDGQSAEVDLVILCTGYQYSFPFLDPALRLRTRKRVCPEGLYKGIFLQQDPRLIYLGMQYQYYAFLMADAQAYYARDVIMGRLTLPPAEARAADLAPWLAEDEVAKTTEQQAVLQARYLADLFASTDYPPLDLAALVALFVDTEVERERDILHYRDITLISPFSGTRAADPPRPWLENFEQADDDLLEPPPV
jgi:trimethylamine monooxygenase